MPEESRNNEHLETFVKVNGKQFRHTQANGLSAEAVLELEGFIRSEASKYLHSFSGCSLDMEDLVQEGRIGALKAAIRFNPGRNVQFITYSSWYVMAAMREAVNRGMIHTPRGQKQVRVSLMDSEKLGALESVDPVCIAEELERRDLYERALEQIKKLPEARASLILRYIHGDETMADIAKDLGVSRQRVSQILQAICCTLRASIAA